jgi:hypothetical protein
MPGSTTNLQPLVEQWQTALADWRQTRNDHAEIKRSLAAAHELAKHGERRQTGPRDKSSFIMKPSIRHQAP